MAAVLVDFDAGVVVAASAAAVGFDVVEDEDESSWVSGIDGDLTSDDDDVAWDLFNFDDFDVLDSESVALRLSLFADWSSLELEVTETPVDEAALPLLDFEPEMDAPCWDFCFFF